MFGWNVRLERVAVDLLFAVPNPRWIEVSLFLLLVTDLVRFARNLPGAIDRVRYLLHHRGFLEDRDGYQEEP